ncbi:MarR family winged helix-turn-helix transcriptional regulator [Nocardia sp. NPDC058640]|uniref:MarR family winged helix-turn-helix transcriptional regulator n=1 Tax=Nocardia sp. NPDC058640 TaxID=3346571 RepID=UPI0036487ADF
MASDVQRTEESTFRAYLDAVGLHSMAGATAAGLQPTEWYALSQLASAGALTSGQLSARIGLTTGATTRLIDRLERVGYVRRVDDPDDRRKVVVEPVAEALAGIGALVAPARSKIAEILDHYTPEQRELLFDYFARATPAFQEATEQIRSQN